MALLTNINGKFSVSDAGAVTFNDAFTFPTADGAANYILKTNGSGQLAWAANPDEGVTRSGTVADNRLALWKNDDEIKSNSNLFYGSQYFTVGVGTTGGFAALRINADPIGQLYLDFTEGSTYVKRARIQVDTSDNITISNTSSNTLALTIDSSQNAIFEEDVDAGNFKINGGQGSDGQVMTSTGSGVAWETPTTGTVTGTGAANRVTYWSSATNVTSDAGFTYNGAGRVNTDESFGVSKDGANTVANGPFFRLTNAAQDRQYLWQLDASNNIDYWYYNGSAWTQTISLLTDGGATFSGDVNINKKLSVGGLNGTNSQLTVETPTVAAGGTIGASVFGFTGTSETTSTSGIVTPTNQIQFKPAMPAGYGVDGYNSVLEQQSGGTRVFYFRTSGASHLSIDVEHNGTFGGGIFANTGAFTGLVSGITPTAAANFTTKAYVDGVVGSYLPLAGGTMAGTINMNNNQIINVGGISINDPGPNEGIQWNGGNGWAIYESPNDLSNASGNLQFVQSTTRRFTIEHTTGNVDVGSDGINKGAILTQNSHFVNKRFSFDPLVSNTVTAYMILCENAANQDVNGIITMDRTSGLRHACSVQVLISSGSASTPVGGLKAMGTAGNGTPFYELVTCDYDDGTGSSSHIAVQISNPDGYYETSGAYFTGRIVNSNSGVIVPVLPAAVSNVAIFQSNTIHNFQGNLTVNQGNIGVGNSTPSFAVNTNYSMQGSSLAYLNGTSANQTVTNNIGVTHSSTAVGTGSEGGLYLANNDNTIGAPSPIIFFSAKSASNTYNHAYAAIYGIKTASGADSNWNRGELTFATGDGTGPRRRMTIDTNGNVGIGETNPAVPLHISKDSASGENIALLLDNNNTTAGNEIGILFRSMVGSTNTDFEIFGVANAANDMDLVFESDGSNERVRFTGDGNVGIGTTDPQQKLTLGSVSAGGIQFNYDSTNNYRHQILNYWNSNTDSRMDFNIARTSGQTPETIMSVGYGGNVGIAMTNPVAKLDVNGAIRASGGTYVAPVDTATNVALVIENADYIYTRDSAAYLRKLIGKPADNRIEIGQNGTSLVAGIDLYAGNSATGNYQFHQSTNIICTINSSSLTHTGDIVAYSDARLKSNVKKLDGSKVYNMRGVSFDKDGKKGSGVIAQEMQEIAPELVYDDGKYLGVAYGNLSGYLIEAIKELKAEIEELKLNNCNCNK